MVAFLLTLAALAVLPWFYARDARRARQRRGEFFANSTRLFETYRVTQEGMNYPVLEARYQGLSVRLEPVIDNMGWRKLPSLWLKASLLVPNPTRGMLDFLVRPQGVEFYSPSYDFHEHLRVPASWPQNALLATLPGAAIPSLDQLTPHIEVFDDQKTKELVVTPHGIRLVYQAAQAERADYLVLRQATFTEPSVDPALVQALLDRLIAIAATLDAAPAKESEAA
ncbi:MAG: hypothetical protein WDN02_14635 [Methylovirgula sp.]|uniref:hypothetical protein n=1 Tax=Methylovirgula sp. TaxID=1978224 RepID=UPI003075F826